MLGYAPSLGRWAVSEDVKHGLQRALGHLPFVVVVAKGVFDRLQYPHLHQSRAVGVAGE